MPASAPCKPAHLCAGGSARTVMDIADPAWAVVLVSAAIGGSTVVMGLYHGRIQKKTNSANIAMKFVERFEQDDFRITSDVLAGETPPDGWDEEAEIEKMMNCFEDMGKFEKDGTLLKDHIIQMHRDALVLLQESGRSKKIFDKYREKDSEFYYTNLNRLFGYVSACGSRPRTNPCASRARSRNTRKDILRSVFCTLCSSRRQV